MTFRTEAKQRLLSITTLLTELWNDPFRHVREASADMDNRAKIIKFSRGLEELVDLLWDCQQYGPKSVSEQRYQALRESLGAQYKDLRPFLIADLRFDVEDERVGLIYLGRGSDAFEAIWAVPSLRTFAEADDVFFNDRVARAKDALDYYNDHLHCLAEAA